MIYGQKRFLRLSVCRKYYTLIIVLAFVGEAKAEQESYSYIEKLSLSSCATNADMGREILFKIEGENHWSKLPNGSLFSLNYSLTDPDIYYVSDDANKCLASIRNISGDRLLLLKPVEIVYAAFDEDIPYHEVHRKYVDACEARSAHLPPIPEVEELLEYSTNDTDAEPILPCELHVDRRSLVFGFKDQEEKFAVGVHYIMGKFHFWQSEINVP